jgi:transcriptional regulator with XRE-family HTH domain
VHVVRKARKDAGLTLQQTADRAGCSLSTLAEWETGKHTPVVSTAVRICDVLGLSVADILHEYGFERVVRRREANSVGR